ncbi:hypothetical protein CIW54_26060 [Paraburkholderia sp. T12-10]|nr:hypothetical protein CIW54_26060 [Paraburkholderia sp. T12-10]
METEGLVPSLQPLRWHTPYEAPIVLKALLDCSGGVVENVMVRLALDRRYPLRGQRYRLARYALAGGTSCWIDVVDRRCEWPASVQLRGGVCIGRMTMRRRPRAS